ncbi:MAG: hypothetical protein ACRDYX_13570 [Egibacteraceae bacterium]
MSVRTLFAVVNAAGSLDRGEGARGSRRVAPGQYEVIFRRDVTDCAYVATIGVPDDAAPPAGEISVGSQPGDRRGVQVRTRNSAGNPANRGFHLVVVCPDDGDDNGDGDNGDGDGDNGD